MLNPLSLPVAIAEILALLALAAFIGWLLGRLVMGGRIRSLRTSMADKQAELADCWQAKSLVQNVAFVEPVLAEKLTPPAFIPADPLLPVVAPDETPAFIDADLPTPSIVGSAPDEPIKMGPELMPSSAVVNDNSETAVLNRIATRANEINFDRIGLATATEADDLKDIVGVGPFLERKLHSLGIYTFRQIANFTKEDAKKVNEIIEFFPGRIDRDNWVEQAREFYERKAGEKGQ